MAAGTASSTIEEIHARLRLGGQRRSASQHRIEGRVVRSPFEGDEGGNRVRDVGEGDGTAVRNLGVGDREQALILRNRRNALRQDVPGTARSRDDPLAHRFRDIVLLIMPGHLVRRKHGEHRLRRKKRIEPHDHLVLKRRAQARGARGIDLDPPVMEHHGKVQRAEVEQRRRVAGDALLWQVRGVGLAGRTKSDAPLAHAQRQPVRGREFRMMARRAGDVAIAGEDRIVEQKLPQPRCVHRHRPVVRVAHRPRNLGECRGGPQQDQRSTVHDTSSRRN